VTSSAFTGLSRDRVIRSGWAALTLAVAALALFPIPASAQEARSEPSSSLPSAACDVAETLTDGGPRMLVASCGGQPVVLGPETSYRGFRNDRLGATIVDLHDGAQRRILLLSSSNEGRPRVESIGGAIALEGASEPVAVTDLDIDFRSFATDGVVGLRSPAGAQPGPAKATTLRIGDRMARQRASITPD
jgi:hypothetical protein